MPCIYMLYSKTKEVMKFPKKLDTPEFIKAKIILRWAERSKYAIEIMQ